MKKFFLISIISISYISLLAQKIETNEIDKFTNAEIVKTKPIKLYTKNLGGTGLCNAFECSIRRVNDNFSMPSAILTRHIEKYTEDSGVSFLFESGETLFLKTDYTGISSPHKFGNGHWFETCFSLSPEEVEILLNNKITAVRIYYLGGYYDHDIKDKNQDKIIKMIELVKNTHPQ